MNVRTAIVLVVLALPSACSFGAHDATPTATSISSIPAPPPSTTSTTTTPPTTYLVDSHSQETVVTEPVPAPLDTENSAQVTDFATQAVAAYASHEPYDIWWPEFEQYLDPTAAGLFVIVDPATVEPTKVTGTPTIIDQTSVYVTIVEVPTDAGPYVVTLYRRDADDTWHVSKLTNHRPLD